MGDTLDTAGVSWKCEDGRPPGSHAGKCWPEGQPEKDATNGGDATLGNRCDKCGFAQAHSQIRSMEHLMPKDMAFGDWSEHYSAATGLVGWVKQARHLQHTALRP
ncbi:hypothetical protein GCM10007385_01740 [Tateyamaria omphalii]|nr:hypothetical protein GCM10007385_01740 [Tateyamaria omphalii]